MLALLNSFIDDARVNGSGSSKLSLNIPKSNSDLAELTSLWIPPILSSFINEATQVLLKNVQKYQFNLDTLKYMPISILIFANRVQSTVSLRNEAGRLSYPVAVICQK